MRKKFSEKRSKQKTGKNTESILVRQYTINRQVTLKETIELGDRRTKVRVAKVVAKGSGLGTANPCFCAYLPLSHSTIYSMLPGQMTELSAEQSSALDQVGHPQHQLIFVTGKAGTGKSTLLRQFVQSNSLRKVVLAPTGLAAINVGGQTIHSFFQLPLDPLTPGQAEVPVFNDGHPKKRIMRNLDLLVIDEVSMVRADLFDAIDTSLRLNRQSDKPFGGVPVVVFGDVAQLEPVVSDRATGEMLQEYYDSPFFFDSHVAKRCGLEILHLTEVHRQTDEEYVYALDKVRLGESTELDYFNHKVGNELDQTPIHLTFTNGRANAINTMRLGQIHSQPWRYDATVEGDFRERDKPVDPRLTLKLGSRVMFARNGTEWVNGSLGTVTDLEEDEIGVKLDAGPSVRVGRVSWERVRYTYNRVRQRIESEPVGTFTQFPLRLAWAITVHKSQGLTFDQAVLDFDQRAFAHGQVYVGLSRTRMIGGLSLTRNLTKQDIVLNGAAERFLRSLV